jgi:hypothetical protein
VIGTLVTSLSMLALEDCTVFVGASIFMQPITLSAHNNATLMDAFILNMRRGI